MSFRILQDRIKRLSNTYELCEIKAVNRYRTSNQQQFVSCFHFPEKLRNAPFKYLSLFYRFHPRIIKKERPNIRLLFYDLRDGLTGTMSGFF